MTFLSLCEIYHEKIEIVQQFNDIQSPHPAHSSKKYSFNYLNSWAHIGLLSLFWAWLSFKFTSLE